MNLLQALATHKQRTGRRAGYHLLDNILGFDDGVETKGEKAMGGLIHALKNPVETAGNVVGAVKGDLDNLMFEGGAMQRPEDVLAYAAAPMAPGARNLLKNTPNQVNALNASRRPDAYAGGHRAPTRDGYSAAAHDLSGDIYPDDIYSGQAVQYYGTGNPSMDRATMAKLHALRGDPNADVKIYRAVPKGQTDINAGDWVTVNKQYARDHGDSWLDGNYDIIEETVPAGELFTDGNSVHEFGWDPAREPGIKYKDAGSRGADGGSGTSNYVVFDENLIEIVKKYGVAGAATMLGVAATDVQAAIDKGANTPKAKPRTYRTLFDFLQSAGPKA